jgi:hypothetical protein
METDRELIKDIGKLEAFTDDLEEFDAGAMEVDSEDVEGILTIIGRTLLAILK